MKTFQVLIHVALIYLVFEINKIGGLLGPWVDPLDLPLGGFPYSGLSCSKLEYFCTVEILNITKY